jgi:dienelactone hydrolase
VLSETISYQNNSSLEAFVAYPKKIKSPLVILCHSWKGRDSFITDKALEIAQWGYVGFALDMYGKGVLGRSKEENAALKKPFIENRNLLQSRVHKAFEVACSLPNVDNNHVAILGYGFGGICALDLARSGANLKGAISIYGHFDSPLSVKSIKSKILLLHGYKDPISAITSLRSFENELNAANVDWQTILYGDAMHAFASPEANDSVSGILYNPIAASRSWLAIKNFLNEIF